MNGVPDLEETLVAEIKADDPDFTFRNTGDHFTADATVEDIKGIFEEAVLRGGDTKNVMVVGDRDGEVFIGSNVRQVGDWTGKVSLDNFKNLGSGDGPALPEVYVLNVTGGNRARMSVNDTGGGEG